jgi:hypothetical protein
MNLINSTAARAITCLCMEAEPNVGHGQMKAAIMIMVLNMLIYK